RKGSGDFFLEGAKRRQAFKGPPREIVGGLGPLVQRAEQFERAVVVDREEAEQGFPIRHRRFGNPRNGLEEIPADLPDLRRPPGPEGLLRLDQALQGLLRLPISFASAPADSLRRNLLKPGFVSPERAGDPPRLATATQFGE